MLQVRTTVEATCVDRDFANKFLKASCIKDVSKGGSYRFAFYLTKKRGGRLIYKNAVLPHPASFQVFASYFVENRIIRCCWMLGSAM